MKQKGAEMNQLIWFYDHKTLSFILTRFTLVITYVFIIFINRSRQ